MVFYSYPIDVEVFPVWAYGAVGGGVLFVVLVTAVISLCCARKNKKLKPGKAK